MTSLVYLCARPQEGAAAAEYESFRTAMRLGEDELERWDLVRETLPSDFTARWRGAVVGGSPFNVTDPEDTKTDAQRGLEASLARLADAAASGRIAALFTCYGIGVATRTLGGEVTRAYPEDTGPTPVALTDDGRADPLFGALAHRFTALTAHKEGTATLPPGAVLLAENEGCPVQAYRANRSTWVTQFHPEMDAEGIIRRMGFYMDAGYFKPEEVEEISGIVRATGFVAE